MVNMLFKIIFLVFIFHKTTSGESKCYVKRIVDGKEVKVERCCYGYYEFEGICKECPNGYVGLSCSDRCTYPGYGKTCASTCNCTKERCSHEVGCTVPGQSTTSAEKTSTSVGIYETTKGNMPDIKSPKNEFTGRKNDTGETSSIWIYVVIITSILVMVLIVIFVRYGYGKTFVRQYIFKNTEPVADSPLNCEINSRPPDQSNIDINFRHLNQSDPEEDVYCEIRESMMVDTLQPSTSFTPHLNQMTGRRSSMRDNVYNHLHFNKSFPNLVEVNEYSHADSGLANLNINNKLNRSDNHLCEVRKSKAIEDYFTSSTRESLQENRFSNNYYQIWENNNI